MLYRRSGSCTHFDFRARKKWLDDQAMRRAIFPAAAVDGILVSSFRFIPGLQSLTPRCARRLRTREPQ